MLNLVLIVFVIVAIIYLFNSYQNKYQSFQGVIFNLLVVSLLIFLLFSVSFVYTKTNPELTSFGGFVSFVKVYFSWVLGFFSNVGDISGYVVKQNWEGNLTSP